VSLPVAAPLADWSQAGGNAAHSVGNVEAPANIKQVWSVRVGPESEGGSRVTVAPIVAQGKVFAMDSRVRLSAFDARTGKGLWRTELAISIEHPEVGFGGGAAFDNGKLFVSTGFGDVFALNPNDGAILWRSKIGDPFRNPPAAVDGRVYLTSVDN